MELIQIPFGLFYIYLYDTPDKYFTLYMMAFKIIVIPLLSQKLSQQYKPLSYNGLLRLLYTFSVFSIWFLWLETALFWTNFSHFLWQGLQSLFCQPFISMVILNSGLIWLKMDISLRLKMPYLHDKMSKLSKRTYNKHMIW